MAPDRRRRRRPRRPVGRQCRALGWRLIDPSVAASIDSLTANGGGANDLLLGNRLIQVWVSETKEGAGTRR